MRKLLSQLRRGDTDGGASPPPAALPVLPANRPRRLSGPIGDAATSASALFQVLPSEIRRKILIAAFGGDKIHLDLRLAHPLREREPEPAPKKPKPFWARAGGSSRSGTDNKPRSEQSPPSSQRPSHANAHSYLDRDTTKPRRWEWHGSICHRPLPLCGDYDEYPAAEDECTSGLKTWRVDCALWPGEMPHKCRLGVMGWLRACRTAYVEGVEVLYGTNRIHIQGTFLCGHLPEVMLPQRLAAVAKVELVWDLRLWGKRESTQGIAEGHPEDGGVERYQSLASTLPGVFPGLKSLHIALRGWPIDYGKPEGVDLLELLLQPLDDMVRGMVTLQECRISVPHSLYKAFRKGKVFERDEPRPRTYERKSWWEVRRNLRPPLKAGSSGLSAYVITQGQDDAPKMIACFGSSAFSDDSD
ncbi:hypothetical protein B0T16DRAFT_414183 [Cercophora newfieldiana]|uniref:DUF7730 domain-containing protein n=1 Tax=Cercophora newfieldiana TaxID=92897 RepID=A0AA39Y650_9PEZI|nr:hypothetical protein B0T16DRAFT_414183 [Cercophora newfieldiana]